VGKAVESTRRRSRRLAWIRFGDAPTGPRCPSWKARPHHRLGEIVVRLRPSVTTRDPGRTLIATVSQPRWTSDRVQSHRLSFSSSRFLSGTAITPSLQLRASSGPRKVLPPLFLIETSACRPQKPCEARKGSLRRARVPQHRRERDGQTHAQRKFARSLGFESNLNPAFATPRLSEMQHSPTEFRAGRDGHAK
jgi:hypothetical protein